MATRTSGTTVARNRRKGSSSSLQVREAECLSTLAPPSARAQAGSAGRASEAETVRRADDLLLERRRLLQHEPPRRVAEAIAASEDDGRAIALVAQRDDVQLDVEVAHAVEIRAQRLRFPLARDLAHAPQHLDVVRPPGGRVAVEPASDLVVAREPLRRRCGVDGPRRAPR